MHGWVEKIGELYPLNGLRWEVWDEKLSLEQQAPEFQARHQVLSAKLTAMAEQRDLCLKDPNLHSVQKKVLNSLKNPWSGLTVFLDHPQTPKDKKFNGWCAH
jgi:transposase